MQFQDLYFISYNHRDRHWAEWVAWTIEDLGYKTVIQAWDFLPGKSWVHEMQTQVAGCKAVVCVLSENFLDSEFTAAEWEAAFATDPLGQRRRLIPLRVSECEVQGFLQTRIYVDLVGKDRDGCRDAIRRALTGERGKPASEPTFPGAAGTEPTFPGRTIQRFALVLDGIFEEYDRRRVEALTEHLRKVLKDSSLSIVDVRQGTVIVTVESSFTSANAFGKLREEQHPLKLLGDPVLAHWKMNTGPLLDPVGQRLAEYGEWLQAMFEPQIGTEAAKDLVQDFDVLVLTAGVERYAILERPALAAQFARGLLMDYLHQREEETIARAAANIDVPDIPDRDEILRLSMLLFEQLDGPERDLIENYWSARFEGEDLLDELEAESRSADEELRQRLRFRMFGEEDTL